MTRFKLEMTNEVGATWKLEQERELFMSMGESEIDSFKAFVKNFLCAAGYLYNREYLFMEDVTEDEYDMLICALDDYRAAHKDDRKEDYK